MSEIIPHWLTKQAGLSPDYVALEFPNGEQITFKELQQNSESYARRLAALGVEAGTRIGVLSANQPEMVYTIHALSYLGAVGILLNTRLSDKELQYQLQDAEASLLITDTEAKSRSLKIINQYSFLDLQATAEADIELLQEIKLNHIFTIIYTSGTTGFPKGVMHTYGNHWWNAIASALNLGLDKADKWLISLPLFHVSGLSTLLKSVIYGMPIYLMKKFDESQVHEAIMKKQITVVSVVTVMVQRLIERMGDERYPKGLRCFLLGGGPAPQALLERAKEKAIPVFQSYGMTETASQIVTLSPNDALNKLGSAGKPLLPAQLKIENPGIDGIGEIIVKGPTVTAGYYNNPKANKESFSEGWFKTGDLGYIDQEGYLYVVDRRTDLIISGGENIYPSEIENALMKMPEIKEAGVTKLEDETWGQIPVAYVVANKAITETEIIIFLKQHLAKYKLPKKIYFIDQLPRNAANKLVRNKLQNK
ncbi:o-succinylbenzoate--CoA ligase [Ralstonia pickettii]|nr:o-succinylbenzoate--CoA ligase [Ralstonia pickettii]